MDGINTSSWILHLPFSNWTYEPCIVTDGNFSVLNPNDSFLINILPCQNSTTFPYELPLGFRIIIIMLYMIIVIASLCGNSLLCYILYISPAKQIKAMNYFFINFAISDILMGTFCAPFTFMSNVVYQWWPFGSVLCPIINFIQVTIAVQRSLNMIAVCFERHHVITKPMKRRFKRRTVKAVIAVTWILAVMVAVPTATQSNISYLHVGQHLREFCLEIWSADLHRTIYSSIILLVQYGIPLVLITILDGRIAYVLIRNKFPGEMTQQQNKRITHSKRKSIKMLVTVVSTFLITWLPLHCLTLIGDTDPSIYDNIKIHMMWICFHWLSISNSGMNCIIYMSMSSEFRDNLRKLLSERSFTSIKSRKIIISEEIKLSGKSLK